MPFWLTTIDDPVPHHSSCLSVLAPITLAAFFTYHARIFFCLLLMQSTSPLSDTSSACNVCHFFSLPSFSLCSFSLECYCLMDFLPWLQQVTDFVPLASNFLLQCMHQFYENDFLLHHLFDMFLFVLVFLL